MIRLSVAVALLLCGIPRSQGTAERSENVVVSTEEGRISGFREQSTKGRDFYSFHSIPFAKPPVGNLRFKDPVSAEGWHGVRDGSVVPPLCLQIPFITIVEKQRLHAGDEDCLYLSVFTSKPTEPEAKLPVMVFIHGGGFLAGGIQQYTPYVLLNEDIVLVFIQYRLGFLGFLSTEDSVIPGNFGLKDQTMALRWIQRNIHHFGGDSTRVTLFGESAGGASVHFHILSPYSKGLFKRGIMQSGTLLCPWAMGGSFKEVAEYTRQLFSCPTASQEKLGGSDSHDLLRCLQTVNAVNLTHSLMDHILFNFLPAFLGPRVDGEYIPSEPEVLMLQGDYNHVDFISGITSDEGGLFAIPLYASEQSQSDLVNNFAEIGPASLDIGQEEVLQEELAKRIFNHYVGGVSVTHENADSICKMYGDRHFIMAHDMTAILNLKNESPHKTFLYELNHRGQRSLSDYFDAKVGQHWVSHVDDLFYLFTGKNVLWQQLEREEDLKLRDIMTKLWSNFAATGNPTPDDSLGFIWESTKSNLEHLSLTPTPAMDQDKRKQIREFWEMLPTKQNLLLDPSKVVFLKDDAGYKSGQNLRQNSRLEL